MKRDPDPSDQALPGGAITDDERLRARRLSRLVDDLVAGRPAPPALDAEDRSDLQAAQAIRAALRPPHVVRSLFATRRRRVGAAWVAFGALAAAALALMLVRSPDRASPPARGEPATIAIPSRELSRPADPLVGRIAPEKAFDARERIDAIYGDRLAGYRAVWFRRGGGR